MEQKAHKAKPIGSINKNKNNTTCFANVVFLTNHKVSKNGKLKMASASKKLKKYSIIFVPCEFYIHIKTLLISSQPVAINLRLTFTDPASSLECFYMVPQDGLEPSRSRTGF